MVYVWEHRLYGFFAMIQRVMSELTVALRELDGLMKALGVEDQAAVQKQLLAEVVLGEALSVEEVSD